MVTAETAVTLPVLLLVLALGLWVLGCVQAELRCVDAAGLAARAAARGEPVSVVVATARGAAPAGATVRVSAEGAQVRVTVRARGGRVGGVLSRLTAPDVSGSAVVAAEEARASGLGVSGAGAGALGVNRAGVSGIGVEGAPAEDAADRTGALDRSGGRWGADRGG
jgi:hypothetical protein